MNSERLRSLLLALPHVVETVQWGDNLVFWVGDKAIGGKMFALLPLDVAATAGGRDREPLISFATTGPEAYAELLEREGVVPAPYFARIHWVSVTEWNAFAAVEWRDLLEAAHARVLAKHTARTRANLLLPPREQARMVAEKRRLLLNRKSAKTAGSERTG